MSTIQYEPKIVLLDTVPQAGQLLYRYHLGIFEREFGSWGAFLASIHEAYYRASRIDRYDPSDRELIDEYFRHKSKLIENGLIPKTPISMNNASPFNSRFMSRKYGAEFSRSRYERRWGSWKAFLKHIKEDQVLRNQFKELTKSEYFRVQKLLGRKPKPKDFLKTYHGKDQLLPKIHMSSICRLFGTFTNFLKEIGQFDPEDNRLTRDMKKKLIENYFAVREKLGRRPTILELTDKNISKFGDGTICYHYGNYTNFLIEIGEVPKNTTIYSKEIRTRRSPKAFDATKTIEEQTKHRIINRYLVDKQKNPTGILDHNWFDHGPSSSIIKYWGGWNEFLKFMNDLQPTLTLYCNSCKAPIIVPYYYRGSKHNRRCSKCRKIMDSEQHKDYVKKHRSRINEYAREWKKKHPDYYKNRKYWRKRPNKK